MAQKITASQIEKILYLDKSQSRSRTVQNPSAHFVALCSADSPGKMNLTGLEGLDEKIKQSNIQLYYLIEFMLSSACRISEALAIRSIDCTSTGHVHIHALKKGVNRIVSAGMASNYIRECFIKKTSPWEGWSRFFVYREFKKFGIGLSLKGRSKKSVTHSLRHQVAKSIKGAGMDISLSKNALGHNSLKSTGYYHE